MLLTLLVVPLIGILLILLVPVKFIKSVCLLASLVNFYICIILWLNFDANTIDYQFTISFTSFNFCYITLGIDGLSIFFIILTTFFFPICILSNWNNIIFNHFTYLLLYLLLEVLLLSVFIVLDFLLFYIAFESVLIPLFLIIGIWGGRKMRVRAAFLLFLYTLFGSLFILVSILIIYNSLGTTNFTIISLSDLTINAQKLLFIGFFISIAIKTPLYPFYTWLTFAHTEAPVGGSIILARSYS